MASFRIGELQVSGELKFTPNRGIEFDYLDPIGSLEPGLKTLATVHGTAFGAGPITLLNAHASHTHMNFSGMTTKTIEAPGALVGGHLEDASSPIFTSITLEIDDLDDWLGTRAVEVVPNQSDIGFRSYVDRKISRSYHQFGTSCTRTKRSIWAQNVLSGSIRHDAATTYSHQLIHLHYANPISIYDVATEVRCLEHFLFVITGESLVAKSIRISGTQGGNPIHGSLVYYKPGTAGGETRYNKSLLFRAIKDRLPDAWRRWIELYNSSYSLPTELMLLSHRQSVADRSFQLFANISALEGFHRSSLEKETSWSEPGSDLFIKTITQAMDQVGGMDLTKQRMRGLLAMLGTPSLKARLLDIFDRLPAESKVRLGPNPTEVIDCIVNARNNLAHRHSGTRSKRLGSCDHADLSVITATILRATILASLGFAPRDIDASFQNSIAFSMARSRCLIALGHEPT